MIAMVGGPMQGRNVEGISCIYVEGKDVAANTQGGEIGNVGVGQPLAVVSQGCDHEFDALGGEHVISGPCAQILVVFASCGANAIYTTP